MPPIVNDARIRLFEEVAEAVVLAAVRNPEGIGGAVAEAIDTSAILAELRALVEKHKETVATASVEFLADSAAALLASDAEAQDVLEVSIAGMTGEELASLAELDAAEADRLVERTVVRRRELYMDLKAVGSTVLRGALMAALSVIAA